MLLKLSALLGSIRFWIVTAIFALALYKGLDPVAAVQGWLGVVAAIGTLDSIATKAAGN